MRLKKKIHTLSPSEQLAVLNEALVRRMQLELMGKKAEGPGSKTCPNLQFDPKDRVLTLINWWANSEGYACCDFDGYRFYAHHCVLLRKLKARPNHELLETTDHINRDRMDNRRSNLRIVPKFINNQNTSRTKYYPGVRLDQRTGKWRASGMYRIGTKTLHLGIFLTMEEAIEARKHYESTSPEFSNRAARLCRTALGRD